MLHLNLGLCLNGNTLKGEGTGEGDASGPALVKEEQGKRDKKAREENQGGGGARGRACGEVFIWA